MPDSSLRRRRDVVAANAHVVRPGDRPAPTRPLPSETADSPWDSKRSTTLSASRSATAPTTRATTRPTATASSTRRPGTARGGLLVWRKCDDWTAFTDGATTWINGPAGVVTRPNAGPLFPWESTVCLGSRERLDPTSTSTPTRPGPPPRPRRPRRLLPRHESRGLRRAGIPLPRRREPDGVRADLQRQRAADRRCEWGVRRPLQDGDSRVHARSDGWRRPDAGDVERRRAGRLGARRGHDAGGRLLGLPPRRASKVGEPAPLRSRQRTGQRRCRLLNSVAGRRSF